MPNTLFGQESFGSLAVATVTAGGTTAPAAGTVESWTLSGSSLPTASNSTIPATGLYVQDTALGANSEVILINNISGAIATVVRGADGTVPVAHTLNFTIEQVAAGATFRNLQVGPQVLINTFTPGGWSGNIALYQLQPGSGLVFVTWRLAIANGTVVTSPEVLTSSIPSGYYYPGDSKLVPGNIGGSGLAANDGLAYARFGGSGALSYQGPTGTTSGTNFFYGQGLISALI